MKHSSIYRYAIVCRNYMIILAIIILPMLIIERCVGILTVIFFTFSRLAIIHLQDYERKPRKYYGPIILFLKLVLAFFITYLYRFGTFILIFEK